MATEPSRRRFLAALTLVLGGIPILGAIFVALRSGLAPAHQDVPKRVPLCRLRDVPAADGELLERPLAYEMRRGPLVERVSRVVFVTRENGAVIAMLGECTHLSCPVQRRDVAPDEGEGPLRCPCHGGVFSRSGEVLAGPPPAPLRRLELELPDDPDGTIYVRSL